MRGLFQQLLGLAGVLLLHHPGPRDQIFKGVGIHPEQRLIGQGQRRVLGLEQFRAARARPTRLEDLAQRVDRPIQAVRGHLHIQFGPEQVQHLLAGQLATGAAHQAVQQRAHALVL